jgi:prepilin-type N-terminal cleavage/methylation domain-containing protein
MNLYKNKQAFTLIELLIAASVAVLLSTISMPIYDNLQSVTILNENSLQVVQLLRKARTLSYNALEDKSYGIFFDSASKEMILYTGDSYATRDALLDNHIPFSAGVYVSASMIDKEIHFAKWTGMPDESGYFDIGHTSVREVRRININLLGVVDLN